MRCAICRKELTRKTMAADHDHETGFGRDWLCRNCNTGLGMFQDDPERMRRAAKYIEKHRGRTRESWIASAYAHHPRP
jgi:hypothetical protein